MTTAKKLGISVVVMSIFFVAQLAVEDISNVLHSVEVFSKSGSKADFPLFVYEGAVAIVLETISLENPS